MRIYTRTGDEGETGLFGGPRVPKASPRVDAYGDVDELNAVIGLAVSKLRDLPVADTLRAVQGELFTVGADLATPPDASDAARRRLVRTDASLVRRLEDRIDRHEEDLAPLERFILPGGDEAAACLHLARTVCRRAERRVVALATAEEVNAEVLAYLNRLSDLLFVLARWVNARRGVADVAWEPPATSDAETSSREPPPASSSD